MKANEILSIVERLDGSRYKKILIDGTWGIGKTKYILEAFDGKKHTHYISLFGKKDIHSILHELYFSILEESDKALLKKNTKKLKDKIEQISVSIPFFNLSIPVSQNVILKIIKELSKGGQHKIVFDDIERKHDCLDIKEIFGIIDSLAKQDNIKVIIVASKEKLKCSNRLLFDEYSEKAIDRVYYINQYSDNAPENILVDKWSIIKEIIVKHNVKNLRTLEKISNFIYEVEREIDDSKFSNRLTKYDLYKICCAVVILKVEHNDDYLLLEGKSEVQKEAYVGKYGDVRYLESMIICSPLMNSILYEFISYVKTWYYTGAYCKEDLDEIISNLNNYKENPINLYSSEEEIRSFILETENEIKNLAGTEDLISILRKITLAIQWSNPISMEFGINDNEIISLITNNIYAYIDIDKTVRENCSLSYIMFADSIRVEILRKKIESLIYNKYLEKILNKIERLYINKLYMRYDIINELIYSLSDIADRGVIIERLKLNNYYFPIPEGAINSYIHEWCMRIIKLVYQINSGIKEDVYKEFKMCIEKISEQKSEFTKFRIQRMIRTFEK